MDDSEILKKDYPLTGIEEGLDTVLRSHRVNNLVLSTNYDWKSCGPVLTVELHS